MFISYLAAGTRSGVEGRPGLLDPRGGHPMREWVQLTPTDEATCLACLTEAREFVSGR